MDSNIHQTVETNIKDMFYAVIRRIIIVVLAGVVLASSLFAYKYFQKANDENVLDISNKHDNESDIDYSERVLNVNRVEDTIRSIDTINQQINNQRQYVSNSILMQIDPMNEAVSSAQLLIIVDKKAPVGTGNALGSSYIQRLKNGEYLATLSEELGTEVGYIKELIGINFSEASSVVVDTEENNGFSVILTITIIGTDTDLTDIILNGILDEANNLCSELNESAISHTSNIVVKQSGYMFDNNTRDLQYNAANRFNVLQKQIDTYEETLDKLASELGVANKERLYSYFQYNVEGTSKSTLGSAIKYAIVGFVIGAFLVLMVIVVDYLFSRKFSTQAKFFGRFPYIHKIGIAKPVSKRSPIAVFIDKKTGDDNELTVEYSTKLMAANIKNLTIDMKKVLITGTAEYEKINKLITGMGLEFDIKASIFNEPENLQSFSDYEGIIIVEQRNYSDCKLIAEEIELIGNANTRLLGAIII